MKTNYTRLEPETLAYTARVIADGGEIISQFDVDQAYKHAKVEGYYSNIKAWYSAQFGVKKDVAGAVSVLYDISSNDKDATQATGGLQPIWTASTQNGKAGIVFDGSNVLDHSVDNGSQPCIALAVANRTAGSFYYTIYTATNPLLLALVDGSNNWGAYMSSSYPSSYSILDTRRIISFVARAGDDFDLITDAESIETLAVGSWYTGGTRQSIGASYYSDAYREFLIGDIEEIIHLDVSTSSIETKIRAFENTKWAVY